MTDRAPAAHLRGEFLLQQPGSCRFENTLESLFYDRPIPPFEYSWGETTLKSFSRTGVSFCPALIRTNNDYI
jgi:hypothetical protein